MAMNYTSLTAAKTVTGSIASWVNYNLLDVDGALEDAQALIFQSLRVQEMFAAVTVSISADSETASLPTGYLASKSMRDVTNNTDLIHRNWRELDQQRDYSSGDVSTGKPCHFSVFNELLQFDTKADTAITARHLYYKRPDDLSASNETNFLTTKYPHMLRSAIMASCYSQMRNTEAEMKEISKFSAYLSAANVQNDMDVSQGQYLTG